MLWIAPTEKATDIAALVSFLSASDGERAGVRCSPSTADQSRANAGLKSQEYSAPDLGLIFLCFAEVRFAAQRVKLKSGHHMPGQINHH